MHANGDGAERLYTTGEFARLCGVKKQTLFHYDDIGLLVPELVEDNGYRRYSHAQYQDFLLISCLKEAGMSLAEIKAYLHEEDRAVRERTMRERIEALDERIAYLARVRKILASSFASAGGVVGTKAGNDDLIRLEDRPALPMWATARLDLMEDRELVEGIAALVRTVEPFAVCLASEDVAAGVLDSQRHLLVLDDGRINAKEARQLGLERFERPEGRYGVTVQQPGETPQDAYGRLLASMRDFEEHPGEFFYEEYPGSSGEEDQAPLTIAVQFIPDDPGNTAIIH